MSATLNFFLATCIILTFVFLTMKRIFSTAILMFSVLFGCSQDIMTVIPDSSNQTFSEFIGLKFFAEDFSYKPLNHNLQFSYTSVNSGYVMNHSLNITGLSNSPNIGVGLEHDFENHLIIHFFDASIGYISNTLNWNIGLGAGYYVNLNKSGNFSLRGNVNLFYENILYFLGSYYDTTFQGFDINGLNIGTYVKDVEYTNNLFCASADFELYYKREKWDYFAGAGYILTLLSREKVNFYSSNVPVNQALYNNGVPVNNHVIMPGAYMIRIGIVREFGL